MRYRLQRHDGTDYSAIMVPITVLRMVPIQRYRHLCGTGSLFVRFIENIESIFIMYIVRSESFSEHLISKAKGATMLNINSSTIADLCIPLPPLPLQQLFAERIEQIEKQKAEVQKAIADLETLLASRMQYWFE